MTSPPPSPCELENGFVLLLPSPPPLESESCTVLLYDGKSKVQLTNSSIIIKRSSHTVQYSIEYNSTSVYINMSETRGVQQKRNIHTHSLTQADAVHCVTMRDSPASSTIGTCWFFLFSFSFCDSYLSFFCLKPKLFAYKCSLLVVSVYGMTCTLLLFSTILICMCPISYTIEIRVCVCIY